jgi:hypothetical protein
MMEAVMISTYIRVRIFQLFLAWKAGGQTAYLILFGA